MYCQHCGNRIPDEARFCTQCGKPLAASAPAPDAAPAVRTPIPPTPPESKKRSRLGRALLWLGAFVIAVVGLALWATSGLVEVADEHLAALRRNDIEAAYALTSQRFREATPLTAYKEFVAAYPILTGHQDFEHGERAYDGGTGHVKGTLSGSGGVASVEFQMVKEGEVWRIQGFELQ